MLSAGSYEVRSLDHPERVVVVELVGRPGGRLRQQAIVSAIAEFWAGHGYAPTVRELGAALGLRSYSYTHRHLRLLESAGRVKSAPGIPRSIRVVEQ